MTLLDKWKLYFKTIHAPAQFIEAGFYFAISAAMERRVWVSSGSNRIFANQYVLFVGPAGVGKGLVTGVVDHVLRATPHPKNAEESLIRFGPTSGSYQRLIARMAEKSTISKYADEQGVERMYPYASSVLILDEFTSFFTEHASEAVAFFCQVWTGNIPYERDTNSRGLKFIKNPSLSLIGGTTPKNLNKLLKYDIIGSGLDRRVLMVFASENEWRQFEIPRASAEQEAALRDVITHIGKLAQHEGAAAVCGGLTYSDEAIAYCKAWWDNPRANTVSSHPMLREYHPNKNSLLHKLAISVHMSSGEPTARIKEKISLDSVKEAIRMLLSYEAHRGNAWSEAASNHNYNVAMRVVAWLKQYGATTKPELFAHFFAEVDEKPFDEILQYLVMSNRVRVLIEGAKVTYESTEKN